MDEKEYEITYVSDGKTVSLGSYETLKAFTLQRCDEYRKECPGAIADEFQLKEAKKKRALLNKTAKQINDRKVLEIKDLTGTFSDQVREICDLIKATANLYDEKIKAYEGYEPKGSIAVKGAKDQLDRLERYLKRNKFDYSRKEN